MLQETAMTKKIAIGAGVLLVLAVLVHHFEKPVLAQVRAALVQSVDEPGRNPLELSQDTSANQVFWIVPAGQRWVIENYTARCAVVKSQSMTDVTLFYEDKKGALYDLSAPAHLDTPNLTTDPVGVVNVWAATGQGPMYVDPGVAVLIHTETTDPAGSPALDCRFSLMGHIINNP
jgi:hypothetical protein